MDGDKLATELLHEMKLQSKRWFILFIIAISLWFTTIIGFVWYISLPVEETTSIEQESDHNSINQVIGGDYNGIKTEGN